jgi:hypothetical protein
VEWKEERQDGHVHLDQSNPVLRRRAQLVH